MATGAALKKERVGGNANIPLRVIRQVCLPKIS
jgi:hypothetical protein